MFYKNLFKTALILLAFMLFGGTMKAQVNLQDGLVAYYPFNGNANDESGNGNHGTVNGNVLLTTDRFGESNSAYNFPGVAFNYISVPNSPSIQLSTFTLNAWVYTDSDYGTGLILNKNRDIYTGHYHLHTTSVVGKVNYSNNVQAHNFSSPSVGSWHLITGSVSGNHAKFYVDGQLVHDSIAPNNYVYSGTEPLSIGMHYYSGLPAMWTYPFKGKIDDIRIYNRVLTSSEISALYSENTTAISFSSATVERLQNFEVPINTSAVSTADGIISYQFEFDYDPTKVQYVSKTLTGTIAAGGTAIVNSNTSGHLVITYMTSTPLNGTGSILKLTFKPLVTGNPNFTISNFYYNATAVTNVTNGVITIVDTTPPTAAITYSDADAKVKPGDNLTITATFSEDMATSPVPQILLSGASTLAATNMTRVSATVYTYTYTVPNVNGNINVSLATGKDLYSNTVTDTPTSGVTFTVDNIKPTAVITYSDTDAKVKPGDVITITATFSESINAAPVTQIALSGAATLANTNMTRVSATVYTYSYTVPNVNGTVTVALATGTDIVGNIVTATPTSGATFTVDNVKPTAVITYSDSDAKVKPGDVITITATFSESINAAPVTQIALSGAATLANTNMTRVSATVYTYTYTVPNVNGTVTVALATGTDIVGNIVTSAPTSGATFTVDNIKPTAVITYSSSIVRFGEVTTITATLSEPLSDSPILKIAISGANTLAATNMTKVSTTVYTYTYTAAKGNGAANVALSIGTDIVGNVVTATPTSGTSFTIKGLKYGDVDDNSIVMAFDAALTLQYSVGLAPVGFPTPWTEWRKATADVDGTVGIAAYDASLILQHGAGLITVFPIESMRKGLNTEPVADVTAVFENGNINFYATGDLYGFNLKTKDYPTQLESPVIFDENAIIATNMSDTAYIVGMANAFPFASGTPFLQIKCNATGNLNLEMLINSTPKTQPIEAVSGIENINDGVSVYPNPTSNVLYVSGLRKANIQIIDISGKVIANIQLAGNQIDVSSLQSGIYSIKITNENGTTVSKFVKQ